MPYQKSQEIALLVKNKMKTAIKNAEDQIKSKNREIRDLVKENEKLKSENITYAEIATNIKDKRKMDHSRTWASYDGYRENGGGGIIRPEEEDEWSDDGYRESGDDEDEWHQRNYRYKEHISDHDEEHVSERKDELSDRYQKWDEIQAAEITSDDEDNQTHYKNDNEGKKGIRYCHFFNRNVCTRPNCGFVHDIAPVCKDFMNNRCRRRFCGYSHPKKQNIRDDNEDAMNRQTFHHRRPVQPGEEATRNALHLSLIHI